MAKIAEIVAQNPWWKHGAEFARFDKNLREARPIFGRNYQGREGHRGVSGPQTASCQPATRQASMSINVF